MLTLLVLLSSGQFLQQGCKQGGRCSLSTLSVSGSTSVSTLNASGLINSGSLQTGEITGGDTDLNSLAVTGASSLTSTVNAGADVVAQGQVSTRNLYTDGGLFFLGGTSSQLTPCVDNQKGRIQYDRQTNQLVFCLGNYSVSIEDNVVAEFQAKTINSGVITSGNNWLGSSQQKVHGNSFNTDAGGTSFLLDTFACQCETAGTGAGNVTVYYRNISSNLDTNCSQTIPCTSLTLSGVQRTATCLAANQYATSDNFGMRMDVSGCTTPPASCVCGHKVYSYIP